MVLYTVILILILAASAWSLAVRVPLKVDLIRDRSSLAREADDGRIENVYTMKIMNATEQAHIYQVTVSGLEGIELVTEHEIAVEAASNHEVTANVRVSEDAGVKGSHKIYFDVQAKDNPSIAVHEKATFILP